MSTAARHFPAPRTLRSGTLRDYGIVLSFLVLFVTLALTSDVFLSTTNLLNLADQWSAAGIIAVAGTLVFVAGGFDISVGSIFALAGVAAAGLASNGASLSVAVLAAVGVGIVSGVLNGALTTVGRINPFIATLATATMLGGVAVLVTDGKLIVVEQAGFAALGNGTLLGVKYSIWIFAGVAVACGLLLSRTTIGRAIYATGGNAEAARLSGIRTGAIRMLTFVLSGVAAGVAGVLVASRVATGQADVGGVDLAFQVISAIVIGGTSILGGAGAVWRTVLGIFLLAMIYNGFNLLGVDTRFQDIATGAIILIAVGVDAWARKR